MKPGNAIIKKVRTGVQFECSAIKTNGPSVFDDPCVARAPVFVCIPFDPKKPDENQAICSNGNRAMKYEIVFSDGVTKIAFNAVVKLAGFDFPVRGVVREKFSVLIKNDPLFFVPTQPVSDG